MFKRSFLFIFLGISMFTNSLVAQDSIVIKKPNTEKIKTFIKGIFPINPSKSKTSKTAIPKPAKKAKVVKEKKQKLEKIIVNMEISTPAYNPIKIKLPEFSNINFKKLKFWSKNQKIDSFKIPKYRVNQIKKSKIIAYRDNIEDINSKIFSIEQKKEILLNEKKALEKSILELAIEDSVKLKLRPEIKDALVTVRSSLAIPVGFTDIDEQIRNLQLLNKIPSDQSLTIRPYYTDTKFNYAKILSLIDSNIQYNGILYQSRGNSISLLPINFSQKLNTDHPYGWNDGAMSYSKGYQMQVAGGIFASFGNLKIQLRPEFVKTASGQYETNQSWGLVTNGLSKVLPGQSSVRYDLGKVSLSASTQNLWWGPGIVNSMLMSNNAPGFFHYSFATNRPLKTFLGNFQFQIISATLKQDSSQGFEHRNLKKLNLQNRDRAYNALTFTFQPVIMKNITFGLTRAFQNLAENNIAGFVPKYLPVLGSFFGSAYNDTINRDQILSFNTRWVFPKNHAEVYFEFGYNDAKDNFRDLMLDMSHASGYIFGFKKLSYLNKMDYLDFGAEVIRMAQTPSYLMRNAGNFYEHGRITEGYTHNNQILGAGSGFGNNMQTVNLSYNRGWNKYGLIFNHIVQNPTQIVTGSIENLGLRTTKWEDFSYGIQSRYRYRNILFSANLEYVNSKNYLWTNGTNKTNFFAFINTIFLW
jgi:Capsule assembly protein Wzi